jgi:protein-S-isoprenylcysteine O-methyltransferase Ste14
MSSNAEQCPAEQSVRLQAYWGMILMVSLYLSLALMILWQRSTPRPWSRLDVFSGGYLLVSLLTAAHVANLNRRVLRSKDVMDEFFGLTFDRAMGVWTIVLGISELIVLIDYSRWHLLPALEQPLLQGAGLVFYVSSFGWLVWTDIYLGRHFSRTLDNRRLMREGPYKWIRHPRYLSLLVNRFSFALILASPLGWLIAFLWAVLIFRRIRLEETHLRSVFRDEFVDYSGRTARLVPGLF